MYGNCTLIILNALIFDPPKANIILHLPQSLKTKQGRDKETEGGRDRDGRGRDDCGRGADVTDVECPRVEIDAAI